MPIENEKLIGVHLCLSVALHSLAAWWETCGILHRWPDLSRDRHLSSLRSAQTGAIL